MILPRHINERLGDPAFSKYIYLIQGCVRSYDHCWSALSCDADPFSQGLIELRGWMSAAGCLLLSMRG